MPLTQLHARNLNSLLNAAIASIPWFEKEVFKLALFTDGTAHGIGVKGTMTDTVMEDGTIVEAGPSARAIQKALEKGGANGSDDGHIFIKDMVRTSVSFPDCASAAYGLRVARQLFTIVEAKDHFTQPKPGGYVDLNLIVVNPNNKHLCELQFHFESMLGAKHDGGHAAYKKERDASHGRSIRDMGSGAAMGRAQRAIWQGQAAYFAARQELYRDPGKAEMMAEFAVVEGIAKTNAKAFMKLPQHNLKRASGSRNLFG